MITYFRDREQKTVLDKKAAFRLPQKSSDDSDLDISDEEDDP